MSRWCIVAALVVLVVGCGQPSPPASRKEQAMSSPTTRCVLIKSTEQTVLDGLQQYRWGAGSGEASFFGALAAALNSQGDATTYDYLMGTSGLAFRIQYHRPGGCPSSPHPTCGYDCIKPAEAAIDWKLKWVDVEHNKDVSFTTEDARREVRRSIDVGRPAVAYSEEADLIVGYKSDGKTFLRRSYCDKQPRYKESDKLAWGVILLDEKKPVAADRKAAALRAFAQAKEMWDTPTAGVYACGQAALEEWAAYLLNDAAIDTLDDKARFGAVLANAHTFCCLFDARMAAAIYLRETAGLFEGEVRRHIENAAELYEAETKLLTEKQCVTVTAPYPWMMKPEQKWDNVMRRYQSDLLKRAAALEAQAISELAAVR